VTLVVDNASRSDESLSPIQPVIHLVHLRRQFGFGSEPTSSVGNPDSNTTSDSDISSTGRFAFAFNRVSGSGVSPPSGSASKFNFTSVGDSDFNFIVGDSDSIGASSSDSAATLSDSESTLASDSKFPFDSIGARSSDSAAVLSDSESTLASGSEFSLESDFDSILASPSGFCGSTGASGCDSTVTTDSDSRLIPGSAFKSVCDLEDSLISAVEFVFNSSESAESDSTDSVTDATSTSGTNSFGNSYLNLADISHRAVGSTPVEYSKSGESSSVEDIRSGESSSVSRSGDDGPERMTLEYIGIE